MKTDGENEFERELELFRGEIEAGLHALFTYLTVHATANEKPDISEKLNATPYFWRTVLYALQSTQFIVLGRIFDPNAEHNVHRLIKLAQKNVAIFSKGALAARKRAESDNADEWLPEYMTHVYEPEANDFRRLRAHVARKKKIYMGVYRDIRRKVFAHRELADREAINQLFKGTTIAEMKEIFVFLSKLYQAFWQLYHNGVKPILRQQPYSVKKFLSRQSKPWEPKTIQELVVKDTQFLLTDMIEFKVRLNP
jgi:hypothetical protein